MIKQHDFNTWPKDFYVAIASLKYSTNELERHCKLKFTASEDDLDAFDVLLLEIDNGLFFMLMRYKQSPDIGVEIWVAVDKVDASVALKQILTSLDLPKDALVWKNPYYIQASG